MRARCRSRRESCRRISGASPNSTRPCMSCGFKAFRRAISSLRCVRCWAKRRRSHPQPSRASTSSSWTTTRDWSRRPLADDYVYIWADGIYLDAGAEDERRVMLAVIGVDTRGDKELFALEDAFGESAESWTVVFESLRERGLKNLAMLVADGAQGIWKGSQRCFRAPSSSGAACTRCATSKINFPRSIAARFIHACSRP